MKTPWSIKHDAADLLESIGHDYSPQVRREAVIMTELLREPADIEGYVRACLEEAALQVERDERDEKFEAANREERAAMTATGRGKELKKLIGEAADRRELLSKSAEINDGAIYVSRSSKE